MITHEKPYSVHATYYPQAVRRAECGESYVYPYTIRVLDSYACEIIVWYGSSIEDCIAVARDNDCPLFVQVCHKDSYCATHEYPVYYDMEV